MDTRPHGHKWTQAAPAEMTTVIRYIGAALVLVGLALLLYAAARKR